MKLNKVNFNNILVFFYLTIMNQSRKRRISTFSDQQNHSQYEYIFIARIIPLETQNKHCHISSTNYLLNETGKSYELYFG